MRGNRQSQASDHGQPAGAVMDRSGQVPTFMETESAVLRDLAAHFARAWAALPSAATSADLERFLPPQGTMMRLPALIVLVREDLTQRWQRGQRPMLDEYLQRFPELGTNLTVAPELIAAEFQARHQFGDRPELSAYRSRFPVQLPQVENLVGPVLEVTAQVMGTAQGIVGQTGTNVDKTVVRSMPPLPVSGTASGVPMLSNIKQADTGFLAGLATGNDARMLQIGGGYKLLKRLGAGSFGEVWGAEAPGGVRVAVKIILRPLDSDEARRELQSLDLIKKLKHPFLLDTQAFWSLEDRLLIVMELADGSLRDWLKECRKENKAVPLGELLTVFRESAEALDYLHSEGVQHRDIKPENILLLRRHAKVADFGLARLLQSLHAKSASMSGTPMYMAPEVWQGMLSPHSDQYSLAFTYTELRLGRPVFKGESLMEVMNHHLARKPDLSVLPAAEQDVLFRALSKNAEERFGSCMEFMQELTHALQGHVQGSTAIGFGPRTAAEFRVSSGAHQALGSDAKTAKDVKLTARPPALATQRVEDALLDLPSLPPKPRGKALLLGGGGLALVLAAVVLFFVFNKTPHGSTSPTPPGGPPVTGISTSTTPGEKIFLPSGCVPGDKAEIVNLTTGGKLYNVIERQLEDGTRIPFRLIADPDSPVRPFYIMENKVTNALFAKFAAAKPADVKSEEWKQGALAGGKQMGITGHERLPVFNVTVEDAHRCAVWLGGRLPTAQQWEAAAGYSAKWKGPYLHDPQNFDKSKDVAVDRAVEGPMAAGEAEKDESPFKVRDMAGNGYEWTRSLFPAGEVPADGDKADLTVELRSRSYHQARRPLTFPKDQEFELSPYEKTRPDISFRVVVEVQ
jgi:hypothetical protein